MRHRDHRGGEFAIGPTPRDPAHEGAIDLEAIDREAAQVAERGVAGAEIVERDLEAAASQTLDHRGDGDDARVIDQGALGDLDFDSLGFDALAFADVL